MLRRMILALAVTTTVALGALFLARRNPVVFAYHEVGSPSAEPTWVFFNPFRDRSPERTATGLLHRLQVGDTIETPRLFRGLSPERVLELGKLEAEYPLTGWKLAHRIDERTEVRLVFRVSRGPSERLISTVWVTFRLRGGWEPFMYESWY
jgi:hypothetical protein